MRLEDIPEAPEEPDDDSLESFQKQLDVFLNEPKLVVGPDPNDFEEDDDETKALALLEDAQDVMIHLQVEEVMKVVPIPVWNALVRYERRISNFLGTLKEDR